MIQRIWRWLGHVPDPKVEQKLSAAHQRSDAVLAKADRALTEAERLEQLRQSFRRADKRLGHR